MRTPHVGRASLTRTRMRIEDARTRFGEAPLSQLRVCETSRTKAAATAWLSLLGQMREHPMRSQASGDTYQRRTRIEECLKLTISGLRTLGPLEHEILHQAWFVWISRALPIACPTPIILPWLPKYETRGDHGSNNLFSARFELEIPDPDAGGICLDYDLGGQKVHQYIPLIASTPCFGGLRWWFCCPLTGERVSALYLPPGERGFASRQAYGLSYNSSRESRHRKRLPRFSRPKQTRWRQLSLFNLDR
jgi:hypothetical protein